MIDRQRAVSTALALLVGCGTPNGPRTLRVSVPDSPSFASERQVATIEERVATQREAIAAVWSDADSPVPVSSTDAMWGSRTAKVTIVTFSDLECPYCARFDLGALKKVQETYGPDKVRLIFKHMPLTSMHPHAMPMAIVGRAIFERGGSSAFFELLHASFGRPEIVTATGSAFEVPAALGLASLATPSAIEIQRYKAEVLADMAVAKKLGVVGTPASFINGVSIVGAQPFDKIAAIVDRELEAVNLLVDVPEDRVYVERSKVNAVAPTPKVDGHEPEDTTTVWRVPLGKAPIRGNKAGALVTIVEFGGFECPFCAKVQPTLEKIRAQYKDDVRIAFRHNLLPFHKRAKPAAILSLEARSQKGEAGFWAAHDLLFDRATPFDQLDFGVVAKRLGLNVTRFEKALTDDRWSDFVDDEMADGERLTVNGTPHFFINGRRISGAQPLDAFVKIIDEEIVVAKEVRAKGVPLNELYDRLIANGKVPEEEPLEKKDVGAIPTTAPTKGPANAKVTIQIFSDFECPYCARVEPTLAGLARRYRNRIRFVWRDMPLPFHPNAKPAANAAREAQKQRGNKGFWAMHDMLFENQRALSRESLEQYAVTQKLDLARFTTSLDASTYDAQIQADIDAAKAAGITGAPSFVINGYFVPGAERPSKFRRVIELALTGK